MGNMACCLSGEEHSQRGEHLPPVENQVQQSIVSDQIFPIGQGINGLPIYRYADLGLITNDFSIKNTLGVGGYGKVYRGIIQGEHVAVKKLAIPNNLSKPVEQEKFNNNFDIEVRAISRCEHINLVRLLGYCGDDRDKLLVFELISNNSLYYHLHNARASPLPWNYRMKIAKGVAEGLKYLHERNPAIIHRDIKLENILLTEDFTPKIGDFGIAKDIRQSASHASSEIRGTMGHIAPEYYKNKKLTKKADVFSFGVVLLELITGEKVVNYVIESAVSGIKALFERGEFDELCDNKLVNLGYNHDEFMVVASCAAACVYKDKDHRPTMSTVCEVLNGRKPSLEVWDHGNDNGLLHNPFVSHESGSGPSNYDAGPGPNGF